MFLNHLINVSLNTEIILSLQIPFVLYDVNVCAQSSHAVWVLFPQIICVYSTCAHVLTYMLIKKNGEIHAYRIVVRGASPSSNHACANCSEKY